MEIPKGMRSSQNTLIQADTPRPKKRVKLPALTREEVESELKKLDEIEARLVKEAQKTKSELERLQENYEKEHVQNISARRTAISTVKSSDKSALDDVQKARSDTQIKKVLNDTRRYLADLQGEISQGRGRRDFLRKELQNIERIELAQRVADLIPLYFEQAVKQKERYQEIRDLTTQLRSTGHDWDRIIDKMVTPLQKICLDTVIPRHKSNVDFETELQSLGGVYAKENVFHEEYADLAHKPHHDLRLDRPSFGTDESGHLGRGGVEIK